MDVEIKQRLKRIVVYTVPLVIAFIVALQFSGDPESWMYAQIALVAFGGTLFWGALDEIRKIRERKLVLRDQRLSSRRTPLPR